MNDRTISPNPRKPGKSYHHHYHSLTVSTQKAWVIFEWLNNLPKSSQARKKLPPPLPLFSSFNIESLGNFLTQCPKSLPHLTSSFAPCQVAVAIQSPTHLHDAAFRQFQGCFIQLIELAFYACISSKWLAPLSFSYVVHNPKWWIVKARVGKTTTTELSVLQSSSQIEKLISEVG